MARLRAGILGNIRGKVAGVVGGQWKDKNYVREYVKPANPKTAAQIVQRDLMLGCVRFAKVLVGPIFNAYTDRFLKSMSGFNYFIKKNITQFVAAPVWANIVISEGKLSPIVLGSCTYNTATGETIMPWTANNGNNGADTDKVFWAVYHESTRLWYFADAEVDRSVETDTQTLPTGLNAVNLYVYMLVAQYKNTLVDIISNSDNATFAAP